MVDFGILHPVAEVVVDITAEAEAEVMVAVLDQMVELVEVVALALHQLVVIVLWVQIVDLV